MARERSIQKAVKWLCNVRNADGGWGMFAQAPSSITVTAEVLRALGAAGACGVEVKRTVDYLRKALDDGNFTLTRHYATLLLGVLECGDPANDDVVEECAKWLVKSVNPDRGWGHQARDERSATLPTAMAMQALYELGRNGTSAAATTLYEKCALGGLLWLSDARNDDGGWGFEPNDEASNHAATSHALRTMYLFRSDDAGIGAERLAESAEFLLNESQGAGAWRPMDELCPRGHGDEERPYPYTHFTTAWAIAALALSRERRHDIRVYRALYVLFALQENSGAWRHSEAAPATVWATAHAVFAIQEFAALRSLKAGVTCVVGEIERLRDDLRQLQSDSDDAAGAGWQFQWRVGGSRFATNLPGFVLLMVLYVAAAVLIGALPPYGFEDRRPQIAAVAVVGSSAFLYTLGRQRFGLPAWQAVGWAVGILGGLMALAMLLFRPW